MTVHEPVLVMAFNRPDQLAVLLQRLREVQPDRLFVAIDGPRSNRSEEAELVQACRDMVSTVDWPCEVRTLFQPENLGCGLGVSTAISWFFECVERGVILEDDVIPDPSFFPFCAELLDRYQDDARVFAISGCNFVPGAKQQWPDQPYRFSQVPHIWGWATWRRSWERYHLDIAGWRSRLPIRRLWGAVGHSVPGTVFWATNFELLARKEVDTWDCQFVFAAMANDALTATSNVNLVENIGFGPTATHTFVDRQELQPLRPMVLPVPDVPVVQDVKADAWTRRHHFLATWRGMLGQFGRYLRARNRRPR